MATITIPSYIKETGIDTKPVDFKWTLGGGSEIYDHENDKFTEAIEALSPRAALAMSLGMGEWVLWRLHSTGMPEVFEYLEAGWAAVVDFRYCTGGWKSPENLNTLTSVLEPQDDILSLLGRMLLAVQMYDTASQEANYIFFLTKHIIRNQKNYQDWLRKCLSRMELLYPIPEVTNKLQFKAVLTPAEKLNYDFGLAVPREVLDPTIDFKIENTASYLNEFLKKLDYRKNRFLRSPQDMVKLGFVGKPYTYPPV